MFDFRASNIKDMVEGLEVSREAAEKVCDIIGDQSLVNSFVADWLDELRPFTDEELIQSAIRGVKSFNELIHPEETKQND